MNSGLDAIHRKAALFFKEANQFFKRHVIEFQMDLRAIENKFIIIHFQHLHGGFKFCLPGRAADKLKLFDVIMMDITG